MLFFIAAIAVMDLRCTGSLQSTSKDDKPSGNGEALAKLYCASCHQYPAPSLIDKNTWITHVLPKMAERLNLENFNGHYGLTVKSMISIPDFDSIVAFYKRSAPKELTIPKPRYVSDWAIFSLQKPTDVSTQPGNEANTVMVTYDRDNRKLYSSDLRNDVYSWSKDLKPTIVTTTPSPAVSASFYKDSAARNKMVITCIGLLNPNDLLKGALVETDADAGHSGTPVVLMDSLSRPVQTVPGDFNRDGLTDYVICGFGNNRGNLYLLTQQPGHKFKKSVISAVPGSENVITGDFNHDGYTDLMCLFAQADEGIWMFLNDKKGGFETQNIMRFPPIYGSSSFQLVDFNHDGKPDIVYTCGDNSDLSPVLKPYHGVYIFINQGNWRFKQEYFYHIDGATKAIANDFDHDGDMDVAIIAYFPNFKDNPQQGFTYLEQTSAGKFLAHELPISDEGRWLTMEAADIDGDGYRDLILGNFSVEGRDLFNQKGVKKEWNRFTPIIVLKNIAGKQAKSSPINSK